MYVAAELHQACPSLTFARAIGLNGKRTVEATVEAGIVEAGIGATVTQIATVTTAQIATVTLRLLQKSTSSLLALNPSYLL